MTDDTEYRLSWEHIDTFTAAAAGEHFDWTSLSPAHWARLPWQPPTVRVTDNPWQQYHTLMKWAETHEQPIRNVRLEERVRPSPDDGWKRTVKARTAQAEDEGKESPMHDPLSDEDIATWEELIATAPEGIVTFRLPVLAQALATIRQRTQERDDLAREQLATKAHLRRQHGCTGGVPDHDAPAWRRELDRLEAAERERDEARERVRVLEELRG